MQPLGTQAPVQPICLAITGASGSRYGLRLLECLLGAGRPVYLLMSEAGELVTRMETGLELPDTPAGVQGFLSERFAAAPGQLRVFGRREWTAPVASGSHPAQTMVICPCTTATLAAVAAGISGDLIERAADVMLKERRQLILVVRETPLSVIHLDNMLKLARLGALILPASPGFYFGPSKVEELVDFIVARVLDHLGVPHQLLPRWGQSPEAGQA